MQNFKHLSPVLLLAFCLVAGCASSKKAAETPMAAEEAMDEAMPEKAMHPLAGEWTYTLDTPQGVYTGVMAFMEVESMLSGTIAADETPDQAAPLEELTFDPESNEVKFKFDVGEFGMMSVKSMLEGDNMDGMLTVHAYGVDVSIKAARKTP